MTLRRAMMSRAPQDRPASRLIHNVDQSWNQPSKYIVTTVIGREAEANRFLTNLIPEMLHIYGPEAAKWFTSTGLSIYQHVKYDSKTGRTTSAKAKESAALVKEDLWDLSDQWKTLAAAATSKEQRPDTNVLNGSSSLNSPDATTEATARKEAIEVPILERLTSDKSVASFRGTFGRETDSDDEREDASAAAAAAAAPPTEITGTQFVFSHEQVQRDHEKALAGSVSDGRSMSTAGKTTDSTRLKLKEAQEQIADLKLALARKPLEVTLANTNDMDISEEERPTGQAVNTSAHDTSLTAFQFLHGNLPSPEDLTNEVTEPKTAESMDTDKEFLTEYHILQAALNQKPKESVLANADAMEEDEFTAVYIGNDLPPLPASTSSEGTSGSPSGDSTSEATSTSSSSSASSEDTHDTQELMDKLSSNQYHALRKTPTTKSLTKIDETSGSQSDSASRQSSGQDSGSVQGHLPTESNGNAGVAKIDAGHGD
jgi:hypothetical protein